MRELMDQGKPTMGTHLQSMWPGYVEIIGQTGMFDYIEFFGTDAAYNLFSLDEIGVALDRFDHLAGMIKLPQELRTYMTERAIGSGMQSVLYADVRTGEDARNVVAAVRAETPGGGIAGWAPRRNVGYQRLGQVGNDYKRILDDIVIVVIIEKKKGVENLKEILGTPGVDMVAFGQVDYSVTLGKPGQTSDPEVKEAERYTYETAMKMGVVPRVDVGSLELAREYMEMGIKDFCFGSDLREIREFCRVQGEALARELGR